MKAKRRIKKSLSAEKRQKKSYGNALKTHDVPERSMSIKLRHDECWVSRGFVKDDAYDQWGKA